MSELEIVVKEIQRFKQKLNRLVDNKNNLLDPEVINASRRLDEILNEYEKLTKKSDEKDFNILP